MLTSDLFPERHAIAARFGLTDVTSESDAQAAVDLAHEAFGHLHGLVNCAGITVLGSVLETGLGADAVILAVGGNALIKTAMDAARPGGKVMLFAQTQHGEAAFDPAAVCVDEKTLLGSYSSSFPILDEVTSLVLGGYRNGFDLTQLISHRFQTERAVEAIDIASHPQPSSMKIMIEPVEGAGAE